MTATSDIDGLFPADLIAPVIPIRREDRLAGNLSIQEKFDLFHEANPWVFKALEDLTADLLAKGQRKVGMKMLFEVVRWQHARATTSDDGLRLNNSLTAHYSRAILATHPEWEDVFETRQLRAA